MFWQSQAQLPSWDRVPTVSPADVRTEVFTARPTRSQSFRDHAIKGIVHDSHRLSFHLFSYIILSFPLPLSHFPMSPHPTYHLLSSFLVSCPLISSILISSPPLFLFFSLLLCSILFRHFTSLFFLSCSVSLPCKHFTVVIHPISFIN